MIIRLRRYSNSGIHGMSSKILGMIWNNDVMLFAHFGVFFFFETTANYSSRPWWRKWDFTQVGSRTKTMALSNKSARRSTELLNISINVGENRPKIPNIFGYQMDYWTTTSSNKTQEKKKSSNRQKVPILEIPIEQIKKNVRAQPKINLQKL